MRLFDEFERTDSSVATDEEDSFSFLNRVAQPYWQRVRDLLEQWFSEYPEEHAPDLRSRLRSGAADQHFAAWWELYLHHVLRCLDFDVAVHPELPGVAARPDFRVCKDEVSLLLEAATTFSGIVAEDRNAVREAWITSAINRVRDPNFFVELEFEKVGTERPGLSEIVRPLESWLRSLDPDAISGQPLGERPELRLSPRDWEFVLRPIPIAPQHRGKGGHRLLGLGPILAGFVNDAEKLRTALDGKATKYGRPDEPYAIAVFMASALGENDAIESALFGSVAVRLYHAEPGSSELVRERNGFWLRCHEPRNTRVSAVLIGSGLMPWTVARVWPRPWPNPWAVRPLAVEVPFPRGLGDRNGRVSYEDVTVGPASLLGLPEDRPGPEPPFVKGC